MFVDFVLVYFVWNRILFNLDWPYSFHSRERHWTPYLPVSTSWALILQECITLLACVFIWGCMSEGFYCCDKTSKPKSPWGGEHLFHFTTLRFQSISESRQENNNLRAETDTEPHGGMLLMGLLFMACSTGNLTKPKVISSGVSSGKLGWGICKPALPEARGQTLGYFLSWRGRGSMILTNLILNSSFRCMREAFCDF